MDGLNSQFRKVLLQRMGQRQAKNDGKINSFMKSFKLSRGKNERLPDQYYTDSKMAQGKDYKEIYLLAVQCGISFITVAMAFVDIESVLPTLESRKYHTETWNLILRMVCLLLNITSVFIYVIRLYLQSVYETERKEKAPRRMSTEIRNFVQKKRCEKFEKYQNISFDIVILLVHILPTSACTITISKTQYDLSILLFPFCILKLYFLIEFVSKLTFLRTNYAHEIFKMNDIKPKTTFMLQCLMHMYPKTSLCILSGVSVTILGYLLRNFELPHYLIGQNVDPQNADFQDFTFVSNGIWCIFVTMTTVGFGDFTPVTVLGRIVAMSSVAFFGLMIVSLLLEIKV